MNEKRYIIAGEYHSKSIRILRCDTPARYRQLEKKYLLCEGGTAEQCLQFAKEYEAQGFTLELIED